MRGQGHFHFAKGTSIVYERFVKHQGNRDHGLQDYDLHGLRLVGKWWINSYWRSILHVCYTQKSAISRFWHFAWWKLYAVTPCEYFLSAKDNWPITAKIKLWLVGNRPITARSDQLQFSTVDKFVCKGEYS